jgi:hypothetical protein
MMFEKFKQSVMPETKKTSAASSQAPDFNAPPKITIEGIEAPPIKRQAHATLKTTSKEQALSSVQAEANTIASRQPTTFPTSQEKSNPSATRPHQESDADARAQKLFEVLSEMSKLPLWVQQVIYTDLKEHLEKNVTMRTLGSMARENFLQLWTPVFTQKGSMGLRYPETIETPQILLALKGIQKYDNVAMMCARYHWSLQEACHALLDCLHHDYIAPPESKTLDASLHFLGDKIRIGEYLQLIGCLEPEELEQALQTQEYIKNAMGESARIADILVRLDLVTHEDVESILFLKDESQKPFRLF